jgi:hypothetical protein
LFFKTQKKRGDIHGQNYFCVMVEKKKKISQEAVQIIKYFFLNKWIRSRQG